MKKSTILKGTIVLVNGVGFTLAEDVLTEQPAETMQHALNSKPLDSIKLIVGAVLDAQQELLKINGSMVREVIQGYERVEKLRTVETIAKLDAAREKLSGLWDCFKHK